jgi:ABC-type Fe3+-hydroxamate transport system substrate-binding protein
MRYTDQMGHTFEISCIPKRIVSLVPSQSEFLWKLGLNARLVGITKFCVNPEEMYQSVTRIGGTKQLDLLKIKSLKPDFIIGNKEENVREQIEALQQHYPVYMSDVNTLEEAYNMMLQLGIICGCEEKGRVLVNAIREKMKLAEGLFKGKRTAYFIWREPYMVAASGTFIHSVLTFVGFSNVFEYSSRYPEISLNDLKALKPDLVLLSSEPYPFSEKHISELKQVLPGTNVLLADGEMFSWYGSRLLSLPDYLLKLKKEIL